MSKLWVIAFVCKVILLCTILKVAIVALTPMAASVATEIQEGIIPPLQLPLILCWMCFIITVELLVYTGFSVAFLPDGMRTKKSIITTCVVASVLVWLGEAQAYLNTPQGSVNGNGVVHITLLMIPAYFVALKVCSRIFPPSEANDGTVGQYKTEPKAEQTDADIHAQY